MRIPALRLATVGAVISGTAVASAMAVSVPAPALGGPAAVPRVPGSSLSVLLSTHRAAARPVEVHLKLRYMMRCGNPGPGSLRVAFPSSEVVPASIRVGAVLVNGKPTSKVSVTGHTAVVGLPASRGISCNVLAPGDVSVVFSPAAGLGNPQRAGSYELKVERGALRLRAPMAIR